MSAPFIGEVRMFGFNFAPRSWAFCQGQLLSIAQNPALFSILGTTYGGNGVQTFGLPDLRGRAPIHWGQGPGLPSVQLGQLAGEENHLLIVTEMPQHNHLAIGSSDAPDAAAPTNNFWAGGNQVYAASSNAAMNAAAINNAGGSQPHSNMQPYLVLNFSIALSGIFPSRN